MNIIIRSLLTTVAFVSCAAQALPVTQLTITDIDGDGLAGCFRFGSLDPDTCVGANRFSSDGSVIAGTPGPANETIPGASTDGAILFGETQGEDDFTLGFYFAGFPMKPITLEAPSGEIKNKVLKITSLPFGVIYDVNAPIVVPMSPDPGTLNVVVTSKNHDNTFNYLMTWSHLITPEDDPSGLFTNFTTYWRLEGVARTCASQRIDNQSPDGVSPSVFSCAK